MSSGGTIADVLDNRTTESRHAAEVATRLRPKRDVTESRHPTGRTHVKQGACLPDAGVAAELQTLSEAGVRSAK